MNPTRIHRAHVETQLGTWLIAGTETGLAFLSPDAASAEESFAKFLARFEGETRGDVQVEESSGFLGEATSQLLEYARGERNEFELALDLRGTQFELSVWRALQEIPFGETRTYGQIARELGDPGASRAVGGANGRNPLPVVVPCHRVVASNGLGGYSGGAGVKETLLAHEGALLFQ